MDQLPSEVSSSHPLAVGMLVIMVYLTWTRPRSVAICPLLVMTCLMPLGQQIVIAGLHLYFFRVLLFVCILRVIVRGETRNLVLIPIDKLFIAWLVVGVVFGTMAEPSLALLKYRLGEAYNAIGSYFFIRCVIIDFEDIVVSVRTLAWMSFLVAGCMLVEKATGHNLLARFGGLPEMTLVRDGVLRCQGAFRHPILAGTFGAAHFPLFVALWVYRPQHRRLAALAAVAAVSIALTASSSGAFLALMVAIGAMALWRFRSYMRQLRFAVVAVLVVLTVFMQAPVWFVFDRLSGLLGGTGWHRAYLIDITIRHFNEWWLFGTTYTAHWGPAGEVIPGDPNNMDITNHFIIQGVSGGLLKLVLFVGFIVACFKSLGRSLRAAGTGPEAFFLWSLGVALCVHCASMLSVSYFDQIIVLWHWLLAVICCVECSKKAEALQAETREHAVPAEGV